MESDFDKEIDAMLRNARRDGPVLVGDARSPHLDADQIAAFAENALPEKARALQMTHMADCDRCRKILSNLVAMNVGAVPVAAAPGVITIAERSIPWYKSLFLFPNLAYVMGGLVLIFGGFLAFTVMQRSTVNDAAMVAQEAAPASVEHGPSFQADSYGSSSNMAANSMANIAPSAMTAANSNAAVSSTPGISGPRDGENTPLLDGTSTGGAPAPAPPPASAAQPSAKDVAATRDDDLAKARTTEDKLAAAAEAAPPKEPAKSDLAIKQQQGYGNVQSQSGPMRNNESQYNRQLENMDARAQKRAARKEEEASGRKVVGGRTFERKQNVWYDTNYQSHPTINVRRGSDEFKRLDAGLRSIANSLSGTIVVVWGAKAYRIQ